jgi:demethylmenaquinone methyltransferase/2-methoxy-6-polyprenyl-1,4-benzoquinol methylase
MLDIQVGSSILEIGTGTGSFLPVMSEKVGLKGLAIGVDLSLEMLKVAQKRASKCRNVSLVRADALNLPLTDHRFDAIFVNFTLELFSQVDIANFLEECHRMLYPQGQLCILAMFRPHPKPFIVLIYDWLHCCFPHLLDCRPLDVPGVLSNNGFFIIESQVEAIFSLPVIMILANPI